MPAPLTIEPSLHEAAAAVLSSQDKALHAMRILKAEVKRASTMPPPLTPLKR